MHALRTLGGVPRGRGRYDSLKTAITQVLGLNRARVEADRWIAFKSHFGIESFSCRPGAEGAHEKGGVEERTGYFRRDHFAPMPVRLIGKRVRVVLHAFHRAVYDQDVEITRHEWLIAKAGCHLEPDHCLEALVRESGAFPGPPPLSRPTPARDDWWAQARSTASGTTPGL
ncbi:hypothetical protein [Streptomyces macrosporus]|uniref:Transposase n=1 Tax=Streptomyces macrosporus TaxID=44032 RepID=A0ABN3KHY8_9ACTN